MPDAHAPPATPLLVVGLGPGPAGWLTAAGLEALRQAGARVFVRTRHHPALEALGDVQVTSLDDLYDQADSLADVVEAIADHLAAARAGGSPVVYAVPGDGALGEAALAALAARGVAWRVVPGVSAGPSALAAAQLSAPEGAQVVEATALGGSGVGLHVEPNPRWPLVVTGVYSRAVAGEVKLALQRVYPTDQTATLVHRAGLADGTVVATTLDALDRGAASLDHLTHVVLPAVPATVPTGSSHGLRAIVARLRDPASGCPWDLEQTHHTLIPFVVEEAYEVVEAIEDDDLSGLMDELGDLLLQVALHAEMADQGGAFEWNDVVRGLSAKLVRRHPHVFGDVAVRGSADVLRNWDTLKTAERGGEAPASALDGVPRSYPALKQAAALGRKARKAGFDWPGRDGAVAKLREEIEEWLRAESPAERDEELGDVLWMLANLAERDGIDPELALRHAIAKFGARFREVERMARERGWDGLAGRATDDLLALWDEAKRATPTLPRAFTDGYTERVSRGAAQPG